MRHILGIGGVLVVMAACGGDAAPPAQGEGAAPPGGGAGGAGGDAPRAPSYGRFGEAKTTFTLPKPDASGGERPGIAYPELTESFPEVDWSTLDRLYIPAGEYRSILLGGLPERSVDRPLVITNLGGQVKVGGDAANYVFAVRGGKGWVLTGRYDPVSRTGDEAFRGHAEGAFAHSQGTYGIFIDDQFSKEGLTGLAIGGGASDFELDTLEVARAEFAGVMAKTDDDGQATMKNVKVHDLYIHDVGSEGIYFGSTQEQPQHAFERLEVYDNRFLRAGTEALQVGQLGAGCEIHHNVLGPGAVRWRSAFDRYQDGNVQLGQRYGSSSFHHNVVIGTGDLFVELFPTRVDGDPRSPEDTISFTDNYFADTSLSGVYTHAVDTGATIRFERNVFLGFRFNYDEVYPDTEEPVQVFGVGSNAPNPHVLRDNRVDGPYPFIQWLFDSVEAEDNPSVAVPRVRFRDFMTSALDADYRRLEWWTDRATLSPDERVVVYPKGAHVLHGGALYEALSENHEARPDQRPDVWRALPPPADDVRLRADSPHQGLGVRW
ncbi:right-handed parallel beta-helix repeat-containing protein [Sorangium sp. So ce131]|uniref:right-handed parallel beta-helix repeat-containing protein n=1 Tax=Sorangium sp. So ce131 TaxID=3133282 RepID=UPI003F62A088